MPLTKSKGNMYDWVTHTISFMRGECPHHCSYCYVQAMAKRFPNMKARYSGPLSLDPDEFKRDLGKGKTIFVEHLNDLFAQPVPRQFIVSVLDHVGCYPGNTYVFQTKNPRRYLEFAGLIPKASILGTTLESNVHRKEVMRDAPDPDERAEAMMALRNLNRWKLFVTVEPILDCDPEILADWIFEIQPDFLNIGADSKGQGLPEPTKNQVQRFLAALAEYGIEVRQKTNLQRLLA